MRVTEGYDPAELALRAGTSARITLYRAADKTLPQSCSRRWTSRVRRC